MRPDIVELKKFYASRQGKYVSRLINHQLHALWPDLSHLDVLGIGYATPFLSSYSKARRNVALMPATQGAARWPQTGASRVALGREDELPFPDLSFDRIILAHALECTPHTNRLMREVWRVLIDGGRLVTIVPNRRGLWCWSDRSPFGFGQPYSPTQLERMMQSHMFTLFDQRRALFLPPFGGPGVQHLRIPAERIGLRLVPHFAGVLIVELQKTVLAGIPEAAMVRPSSRRYARKTDSVAA